MTRLRKAIIFEQTAVIIFLVGVISAGVFKNMWIYGITVGIALIIQLIFMSLANCPFCGDWLFAGMKKNFNIYKALLGANSIDCIACGKKILIDGKNIERRQLTIFL